MRQAGRATLSPLRLGKGFVLNDERLKNPDQPFDYFEELTRRIQDIRTFSGFETLSLAATVTP